MEVMVEPEGTIAKGEGVWIVEGDEMGKHGVMIAHSVVCHNTTRRACDCKKGNANCKNGTAG